MRGIEVGDGRCAASRRTTTPRIGWAVAWYYGGLCGFARYPETGIIRHAINYRAQRKAAFLVEFKQARPARNARARGAGTGHGPGVAQYGSKHPIAKAWKGEGPGVFEVVSNFDGDTFRAVYTVRRPKAVYVLHCFQKKVAQRDSDRSDRCGFDQRTAAACARGLRGEVWQSGSLSAVSSR